MIIYAYATQKDTEDGPIYQMREDEDIVRICYFIAADGSPSVIYKGSVGFLHGNNAINVASRMIGDQELYNKMNGMRIRITEVKIDPKELNAGHEIEELIQIANSMGGFYASDGFPNIYKVWKSDDGMYKITYAISAVSPVDGKKFTRNKKDKRMREQNALESIAFNVTGKSKPEKMFNPVLQEYH